MKSVTFFALLCGGLLSALLFAAPCGCPEGSSGAGRGVVSGARPLPSPPVPVGDLSHEAVLQELGALYREEGRARRRWRTARMSIPTDREIFRRRRMRALRNASRRWRREARLLAPPRQPRARRGEDSDEDDSEEESRSEEISADEAESEERRQSSSEEEDEEEGESEEASEEAVGNVSSSTTTTTPRRRTTTTRRKPTTTDDAIANDGNDDDAAEPRRQSMTTTTTQSGATTATTTTAIANERRNDDTRWRKTSSQPTTTTTQSPTTTTTTTQSTTTTTTGAPPVTATALRAPSSTARARTPRAGSGSVTLPRLSLPSLRRSPRKSQSATELPVRRTRSAAGLRRHSSLRERELVVPQILPLPSRSPVTPSSPPSAASVASRRWRYQQLSSSFSRTRDEGRDAVVPSSFRGPPGSSRQRPSPGQGAEEPENSGASGEGSPSPSLRRSSREFPVRGSLEHDTIVSVVIPSEEAELVWSPVGVRRMSLGEGDGSLIVSHPPAGPSSSPASGDVCQPSPTLPEGLPDSGTPSYPRRIQREPEWRQARSLR